MNQAILGASSQLDSARLCPVGSIRSFSLADNDPSPSVTCTRSEAVNRLKLWEKIAADYRSAQLSAVKPMSFTVNFGGNALAVDHTWTPAKLVKGGADNVPLFAY